MTNISIHKNKKNVVRVKIEGHSGHEEKGKDIVCAGISALSQCILGGVTDHTKAITKSLISEGSINFVIDCYETEEEELKKAQLLLVTLEDGLKDLAEQYPENITIQFYEIT